MFKRLLNTNIRLLTQPAKSWLHISRSMDRATMFNTFLYPMIALCCLATFIGGVLGSASGFESLYPVLVHMGVQFFAFFFSYHIIAISVSKITTKMFKTEYDRQVTDCLVGYSMVVVLLLDACLGLFPNFRIIGWIAQFYTVKIVWDGATVLMRIKEENRLGYTMLVSILIIFTPVVMDKVMSVLTNIR